MTRTRRLLLLALLSPALVVSWALALAVAPSGWATVLAVVWCGSILLAVRMRRPAAAPAGSPATDPGAVARDRF